MTVEFFDVTDNVRLAEALAIRLEVFVDEQGVPREDEIDEYDAAGSVAVHALVRDGTAAVGTGRFFALDESSVRVGRMAVRAAARRSGAGTVLLRELLAEAKRRRFTRAVLHAQLGALGFYERAGFRVEGGELVMSGGIEHKSMARSL